MPKLWGNDCPSFARCLIRSCAARRRASAPSGGNDCPGTRGDEMIWIQGRSQKGRIEVPLHRTHSAGALMPALGERLLHAPATAMTKLAQFGSTGGNLEQGAARPCIGKLFEDNRVAHSDDLVDHTPM